MYMGLALLFWSFRIDQRPDCPINTRASDSVVSHIAPFEIDIIPWFGMQVCFEDVVLLFVLLSLSVRSFCLLTSYP